MPRIQISLPNTTTIELVYVTPHGGTVSSYYNGMRMGVLKEGSALIEEYLSMVPSLTRNLVEGLKGIAFDTIALAPSSRTDGVPFLRAVRARWPEARDITNNFKKGSSRAAASGSLQDLISSMAYTADGREGEIASLLIVDESIATGKTAAAMLEHLKAAGMSSDATTTLAVCCKMK